MIVVLGGLQVVMTTMAEDPGPRAGDLSSLEAMSQAVPVVYSDIPENEEVAAGFGVPFRTGDADDLARAIRIVVDRPEESARRAERGRAAVRRDFDWEKIVDRTEQEYASVLAARHRHRKRHARP